ncbi:mitotic checkpoint regulator, MAD2B-interacting-domain-containing protein [Boletus edulis]|nr:mitotic checkpoint regulator, MAD2B-interacting-domain-containing protein [Boletus edulis]
MLGIEDYGSDVENGDETLNTASKATPTPSTSSLLSKLPPPTSKSTPKSSSSSSLSLPEPSRSSSITHRAAAPKPKRTKKIAINLPSLPPPEDDEDDGPPAKKPRVASSTGAGKSSLLSRLPAPKQPAPVIEKKEERVLGGGGGPGLVFRTSTSQTQRPDIAGTEESIVDVHDAEVAEVDEPIDVSARSTSFLPPSLKKGRANISLEDQGPYKRPPSIATQPQKTAPALDFFSLGSSTSSARSTPTPSTSSASTTTNVPSASVSASVSSSFTVSSAPAISTFRPPSPTLDDPCPGYYQLPSGAYAPYDTDYYASYAKKWKADYDKHIRALEKSQYQPETDGAQDVDMAAEMEKARREIKEREDRKALTMGMMGQNENGEPAMPRMNVKGAKLGTVARSRHQLSTLLTEAYLNRESLEEKIAQGRRNRKEAGMKYACSFAF